MPQLRVTLRFYAGLNRIRRSQAADPEYVLTFSAPRTVKDLIEAEGVPHTEVGLILLNGLPVCGDPILTDGDRLSVFPHFSLPAIAHPEADSPPRFIADVHLGALVRRLRLAGFDCLYDTRSEDPELARISMTEARTLLTRDRGLLMRREVTRGILIQSDWADEQMIEVIDRMVPVPEIHPYTRCLECNGLLQPVSRERIRNQIPEYVALNHDLFNRCESCGRTFWSGTHKSTLDERIEKLQDHLARLRKWEARSETQATS